MRTVVRALVVLALALEHVGAQARDPREVQPERPTVATHAGSVAPGFLEVEWGAEYVAGPNVSAPVFFNHPRRSANVKRSRPSSSATPSEWPE